MNGTLALLRDCAPLYHGGLLRADCASRPCRGVSESWARHDAVYHLMHYILDVRFLPQQVTVPLLLFFNMTDALQCCYIKWQ